MFKEQVYYLCLNTFHWGQGVSGGDISLKGPWYKIAFNKWTALSLMDMGRWLSLPFHRECGKRNLERSHFSRNIRDKGVTIVTALLLAQNHKLCLEMLYLLTKSSFWSQYVPSLLLLYTFHWFCSLPSGFYGLTNDRVYDVYLILREAQLWNERIWCFLWP